MAADAASSPDEALAEEADEEAGTDEDAIMTDSLDNEERERQKNISRHIRTNISIQGTGLDPKNGKKI